MMKKTKIGSVGIALAAAAVIGVSTVSSIVSDAPRKVWAEEQAETPASSVTLLYNLDFNDENNIGKNAVNGSTFADATVHKTETNGLSVEKNAVKGKNALVFPGGARKQNYLSLPVDIFADQDVVTFTGWFYLPSGVGSYLGEIGIYSDTNKAAFRVDPYAEFHNGNYMFCVGDPGAFPVEANARENHLRPMYDEWYHMAYIIDGTNHKFNVYQNGKLAHSCDIPETEFKPSEYNASDAHFYLGQFSYEDSHDDYKGKMSDFRIYGGALDEASIKEIASTNREFVDYKIAEYTFDDETQPGKDSVRGYNLREYGAAPTYENGVMKLNGSSAAQIFDSGAHNQNFFNGVTEMTVSMDIKIKSMDQWKRVMEFCSNGNNYVTYMAYANGNAMSAVYAYSFLAWEGQGPDWFLDSAGYAPKYNEWVNMTFVLSGKNTKVYEDGVLKANCDTNKPGYDKLFADLRNSGNFTIGACTYEDNHNFINAEYDNIRIYAAAAQTAEDIRTAMAGYASFTVTYNANNDTTEKNVTYVRKNTATTLAQCTFEREGYVFDGWNTAADGSGTDYNAGAEFTVNADTTLYAQWIANSYFVTFDANGGHGTMAQQVIERNGTANITECGFSRSGYTFTGWNTSADGTGTAYAAGADISPSSDMTLFAQWQAKTYAVTFDANGGTGEMTAQNLTFGAEAALTSNAFTRHGYVFGGWALTATGVAVYTDGQTVDGIEEGNNVTLYAVWSLGKFTVTFDANGGTGEMTAQTENAFSTATIKNNAFTRSGYTFAGWATSADGEKAYDNGASIAMQDNVKLYALWTKDGGKPADPNKPGDGKGDNGDDNTGLIVGLTVGGVALVAIAGGLAFYFVRKKKRG